tara:strand:- start:2171 stop:2392 length:222 start_codon:yes stop_codon:yes gene_type:complete
MKATGDLATMIGWSSERFARTQKVKSLGEYLQPPKGQQQQWDEDARKLIAMFDNIAAKQSEGDTKSQSDAPSP